MRKGRESNQERGGGFDMQMDRGFGMDQMAVANPNDMFKRMEKMQS
jgi:hypothetical protein